MQKLSLTKDVLRIAGVRLSGQFGDGLIQATIAGYLLFSPEKQTSALRVALVLAIILLPYSIVGPAVGVLADAIDRRQIIVFGNWVRAFLGVCLVLVVAGSGNQVALTICVLLLLSVDRFVLAVLSTVLPRIVSGPQLVAIDGYLPTIGTISAATGAAVAVFIGNITNSIEAALLVASIMYIVSGLFGFGFKKNQLGPEQRIALGEVWRRSISDAKDGITVLIKTRSARYAVGSISVHRVAFGAFTVAIILTARELYADENQALGVVAYSFVIAAAISGLVAVITPTAVTRLSRPKWLWLLSFKSAASIVASLAVSPLVGLGLAGLAVTCAPGANKVLTDERIQVTIADSHRGRAFAIYDTLINSAVVIGASLCALLSSYIPIFDLMVLVTLVVLVLGWFWAVVAYRSN